MKKLICAAAALLLFFLPATGCAARDKDNKGEERLSVVATCFPPYDFARAVAGDLADITMLLTPGAEAHSYEPSPMDTVKIRGCDIFVCTGGESEIWAEKILENTGGGDILVVRLSDFSYKLPEADPSFLGGDVRDEPLPEGSDEEFDEHVWTSLKNAVSALGGIRDAFCSADPGNAALYRENAEKYCDTLRKLDAEFTSAVKSAENDTVVVGDRFPFRYTAYDYGFRYYSAFSGCGSESEPGIQTMEKLTGKIKENGIDTVFSLEFSSDRISGKLCDATGARPAKLYSCHNVSREDLESGVTYAGLMRRNLDSLKEALN